MDSPFSAVFEKNGLQDIQQHCQQVTLPANQTVFKQGDSCGNYLFVLSGSVKVFSRAENGREVTLYRVTQGESCTLTTACLFSQNSYPAEGITETETTALVIPREYFNLGLEQSERFREIVFDQYARRLSEVIHRVEDLSFGHIDVRLARVLLKLASHTNQIEITHQALATELGSAREVISRQLKEFEKLGLLSLQRGAITLLEPQRMQHIADNALV